MASKKILVQLDIQAASSLTSPLSGFVGFSAKADGLYQKIGTAPELRLLTSADVQNAILADGSITGAVSQAQIFTMGVKLYNLTQGYIPYASDATKLLNNSPIYTDGTSVGIGTASPQKKIDITGGDAIIRNATYGGLASANLFLSGGTSDNNYQDGYAISSAQNSLNGGAYLSFSTVTSQANGTGFTISSEKMRIDKDGNVGIGTTDPGAKLSVVSGTNGTLNYPSGNWAAQIYNQNDAPTSGGLVVGNRWADNSSIVINIGSLYGDGTTWRSFFTVKGGGNVGIGTPAPNQQLEITQNFRLPSTTGTTPYGIIYKGTAPFIHDFNYGNNGTVTTAGQNTFVGINAGNFTMGSTAIYSYEASYNTVIGFQSFFFNTTGNSNTTSGSYSLYSNTTGSTNIAIGYAPLFSNTTGSSNVATGSYSLYSNTIGNLNTANGYESLFSNTTGSSNVATGSYSLYSNTTGHSNTANGYAPLYSNTTGYNNTAYGHASLNSNTTGNNNTALGFDSGRFIANGTNGRSTGDNGLYLGYNSKASADGTDNETVIGSYAIGAGSNKTVIGNSSVTDTYFGSSTGSSKLWASAINLSGLTASKVVFTDGSKNLTSTGIGTASQFIKGDGSLDSNTYITSGSISGFVPYTGANDNVNLGTHNLSCNEITTASRLTIGNTNTGMYSDGGLFRIISPGTNYSQFYFYSIDTLYEYGVVEITANPEEGILLTARSNDNSSNSYIDIRYWELGFYTNSLKRLEIAQSGSINAFGNTITSTGGFIGNASTATKLQTARTITIGNQSLSFDGTANLTYSLANIGVPTGSGVDGRITFWSGTNSLSSSANLTWDNTSSRLSVNSISLASSFKLGSSTTAGYVLTADANGNGTWQAPPTAVTIGAIGSVPNANGMSISGQALSLQPASALYGGVLTNSAQTIAGAKTLSSLFTASAGIANNGSYTQSGTSLNTFTGISTFSNATYSALFTGGNVGIGTPAPNQQLEITKNFSLPSTTGTNPYGIIYKDGNRFIHDFNYGNNGTVITLGGNTFIGLNAGNFTMGSTATQAYQGSYNVGLGLNSLINNTTGYYNTANGVNTLLYNTTGYYNTANGFSSLINNTTGYCNTSVGVSSLQSNTTGHYNTANGVNTLLYNTTGYYNTANGFGSLQSNTTGYCNTALGYNSGSYLADGTTGRTTGNNGLYLGLNSKASADGTDNEIVIGYNAIGVGSNKTVLGNSSVTDTYFGSSTGSSKLWASALNLSSLTASKVVFTDGSKNLTSTGIGTASQFIKGDGSLDSNTYLTTGTAIISGSGVDGRITFWNGTNSLSSTSDLEWNNTTKNLGVTGGLTVNDISSNSMSTNSLSTNGFRLIATTTAGYVLTTDANGNGTWQAPTGGGGSYTLPTASASVLGCVKIGSGITISSGVISVSTNYEAPLTFSSGLTRTGNTISFAGSSSYVPYTGATSNVNLGSYIMYANNVILNSDARLKCNIEIIKSKNIDIDYKKYEFKSAIGDIRYGVIAQDLLKIAPELVLGSEKEGYSVKYIDLLIHEIAYLKQEIKKLTGGN